MSSLRPPVSDDQPSSAPATDAAHSRQRSRSLTRDIPFLQPTGRNLTLDQRSPGAGGAPHSPAPHSPNPLTSSSSVTLKALTRQVEFYFSNQNLWRDAQLLGEMARDAQGYVALSTVLALDKVHQLSTDLAVLQSAVRMSSKLQLSDDGSKLRRTEPLPPYDALRDAHRSLYVEHLPLGSTARSVKRLFSVFGQVTYVLRVDNAFSASSHNASPRVSPVMAPASPLPPPAMPRLSLSGGSPSSAGAGFSSPSSGVSDHEEGILTSAFVQFKQASSMQQAVDMIQTQQRAANAKAAAEKKAAASAATNGHGSPMIGRRTLLGSGGSPALSGRVLGGEQLGSALAAMRQTQNERVPHINDIRTTPTHTIRTITPSTLQPSSATSSPAFAASVPPVAPLDLPAIDLNRPSTPNSPSVAALDSSTPLPAVLLTLHVQPKGDYVHEQEEKAERERERQAAREKEQRKERSWRSAGAESAEAKEAKEATAASPAAARSVDDTREGELVVDEDPLLKRMREDARMKERQAEVEREKERERDKQYRRQHLSERVQERQAHTEQLREREREKAQHEQLKFDDGIIHISPRPSPRPSPVVRPLPSPILISSAQSPSTLASLASLSLGGAHSPSLSPSLPPTGPSAGPRFSLTKRTSVVAANVASHFALGPDGPDSKGFNGRGRGKILPLSSRASDNGSGVHGGQPAVQPPALH